MNASSSSTPAMAIASSTADLPPLYRIDESDLEAAMKRLEYNESTKRRLRLVNSGQRASSNPRPWIALCVLAFGLGLVIKPLVKAPGTFLDVGIDLWCFGFFVLAGIIALHANYTEKRCRKILAEIISNTKK